MRRLWYRFRCWLRDYCPKHECYKRPGGKGGAFCEACGTEERFRRISETAKFAQWAKENRTK